MNVVHLHGRIGTDPEIKNFENGGQITNFSFATDESYKNKEGQKVDKTEWHSISVRGKRAEVAEKYFKKGTELVITGKLETRNWEKDGNKFYKTEIVLMNFEFCGSKNDVTSKPQNTTKFEPVDNSEEEIDDLPF